MFKTKTDFGTASTRSTSSKVAPFDKKDPTSSHRGKPSPGHALQQVRLCFAVSCLTENLRKKTRSHTSNHTVDSPIAQQKKKLHAAKSARHTETRDNCRTQTPHDATSQPLQHAKAFEKGMHTSHREDFHPSHVSDTHREARGPPPEDRSN